MGCGANRKVDIAIKKPYNRDGLAEIKYFITH